ncbi:MAG: cupin-like domain-containing protein [Pseudomonadota bacterium]|nr:cupin-like domain-containing protein [Pseudomonadota bacterium]
MKEYWDLSAEQIRRDVLPDKCPAILRGLVRGWPAVAAYLDSPEALVRYLHGHDSGTPVDALMTEPEAGGQIFYNDDMSGFNFYRNRLPLWQIAAQVLRYARFPKPPAVAAQSALIRDCLPAFASENRLALFDDTVLPRIWLGNRITTPTHVDEWNNVGCVIAGRRRFTLFPPEQIGNLYIGPLDFAPTGAAMSMVSLSNPDLQRYPKFREALTAAQTAELQPGDGIFIPPLWWHHVESLEPFNVLVNYWWHDPLGDAARADSAFDALLHTILSIRGLPPETRRAWGAFFAHYVFGANSESIHHLPSERYGILGNLSAQQVSELRAHLAKKLSG